jgi:hypothetical protein
MSLVIKELNTSELDDYVSESLTEDNIAESCYTNFVDAVVQTIGKTLSELLEKDGWKIKRSDEISMFDEKDTEKIFNAFINNSEFTVTLKKQVDKQKYEFKEVIVKFDFSEEEKKKIAEEYIANILIGLYYLDICIFLDLKEVNVDTISEALSNEVYGLLSPEEVKAKFKDAIEETINIIMKAEEEAE